MSSAKAAASAAFRGTAQKLRQEELEKGKAKAEARTAMKTIAKSSSVKITKAAQPTTKTPNTVTAAKENRTIRGKTLNKSTSNASLRSGKGDRSNSNVSKTRPTSAYAKPLSNIDKAEQAKLDSSKTTESFQTEGGLRQQKAVAETARPGPSLKANINDEKKGTTTNRPVASGGLTAQTKRPNLHITTSGLVTKADGSPNSTPKAQQTPQQTPKTQTAAKIPATSTPATNSAPRTAKSTEDYFSLPVAAAAAALTPRSPRSPGALSIYGPLSSQSSHPATPQSMLEHVRLSINSKAKLGVGKDAARRSLVALSEFRNSVDQKRAMSLALHDSALFLAQLQDDVLVGLVSSGPELGDFAGRTIYGVNTSNSSFGSFEALSTASDTTHDAPRFTLTPLERTAPIPIPNVPASGPAAHISVPGSSSGSTPGGQFQNPGTSIAPSPIPIPPSPNAVARGAAATGDNVGAFSLQLHSAEDVMERPRRRKPPEPMETSGSNDEDSDEFPQFPEIGERPKHRLFHLRRGREREILRERAALKELERVALRDRENMREPEPLFEREVLRERDPARSSVELSALGPPVMLSQVKLKSTMRKTSRRKEKKAFNEDKPWKNHSDLDYVSDLQRKKYEALWASNRGVYLTRVVTRLVGVNYEEDDSTTAGFVPKDALSVREISERAARLSSQSLSTDVDEGDVRQLHGLDHVEILELMHAVVVLRIWSRSRLPQETLAAIWDLVDYRKDGTLNRAEFIAGIWLVDQCLYGRKLPKRVPLLVWASLGSLGISVNVKKKRR